MAAAEKNTTPEEVAHDIILMVWKDIEKYLDFADKSQIGKVSTRLKGATVLGGRSLSSNYSTSLMQPGFRSYIALDDCSCIVLSITTV